MGLSYFNGKTWWEITTNENAFCPHLFYLIQINGVNKLITYLNQNHNTSLDPNAHWEIIYGANFYRDLWHLKEKKSGLFPAKTTFDLCLLSEKSAIIIKTKIHKSFTYKQILDLIQDKLQIKAEINIDNVLISALLSSSSKLQLEDKIASAFDGPILTWKELADFYSNDLILKRADILSTSNKVTKTIEL